MIIMEPQIINFYKFKNIQCTICSKRGHLSNKCPNLGSARFYDHTIKSERFFPVKEEYNPDSGSDTELGTSFNTQGKSNGSDEEFHFSNGSDEEFHFSFE